MAHPAQELNYMAARKPVPDWDAFRWDEREEEVVVFTTRLQNDPRVLGVVQASVEH